MATYIEQTLATIERFERTVPWMYLDAAGTVTVGVGIPLPGLADALPLPFQIGAQAATQQQIAAAFAHVQALPMGGPALFYRQPSGPELELPVIDALLRTGLVGLEEHLREHIAGYDALPATAKMALLDMAHHLTPARLLSQYPRLLRAIVSRNWRGAAARSLRHGVGAARNQWTAAMFRAANDNEPTESSLKRLGYGLVGLVGTVAASLRNKA